MNTKTTAVEYIFEKLWNEPKDKLTWNAILEKAKQMEKKQIKDAWFESTAQFDNAAEMTYKKDFEKYYLETYDK
jgi:isoleucyl-tRNA synthetase